MQYFVVQSSCGTTISLKNWFQTLALSLLFGLKSLNLFQPHFLHLHKVDWTKLFLKPPPALKFSNSASVIVTKISFSLWSSFSIPQSSFNHCFWPPCQGISYHLFPHWNNLLFYSLINTLYWLGYLDKKR